MSERIPHPCGCTAAKIYWLCPPAGKIEPVELMGLSHGEHIRMNDLFGFYLEMIEKGCFLGKQNDLDHLLEAFEMNGRLTPDQCQRLYLVARKYPLPGKAAASPSREPGSAS